MTQIKINSKLKSLLLRRILLWRKNSKLQVSAEGGSSFGGKSQNFNYLVVIASPALLLKQTLI